MTILRLLKSRWMLTLPLLLVLAAAVACGEDATPTTAADIHAATHGDFTGCYVDSRTDDSSGYASGYDRG